MYISRNTIAPGMLKPRCTVRRVCRTAPHKRKVTFEVAASNGATTTGRVYTDLVVADGLGSQDGDKTRLRTPLSTHTAVTQAHAIASANRWRMEFIKDGRQPKSDGDCLKWPIVWLKPRTGTSVDTHIHIKKPKALVLDPSRANGGLFCDANQASHSEILSIP